jgi:serine protease Do
MHRLIALIAAAWLAGALGAPAMAQSVSRLPRGPEEIKLSFAQTVKRVAPAVVNIYTRRTVQNRTSPLFDDPFFRRFFGDNPAFNVPETRRRQQNSLGSGVIVKSDGTIVTNYHVIKGADEITVVLHDRREFEASLVRSDERTDLAVLKIQAGGTFPVLEFQDSDTLEVGDIVLAIGNPFGVGQTVTMGIVSALSRSAGQISDFGSFIQTDAAINPGNSGGALVTLDGRLAGINTAIYSQSGGSIGIGFAIPSNLVATVIGGSGRGGRVLRPWLGAAGQAVTSEIAPAVGLDRPVGVVVRQIYPGGPAERAGLRPGDVIIAVDGKEIDDVPGLRYRLGTMKPGTEAHLSVVRNGRATHATLSVELPPDTPRPSPTKLTGQHPFSGATVANLSPAFAEEIGVDVMVTGVVVVEIQRASAAARLGLRPGDIVQRVNDRQIGNVDALRRAAEGSSSWRVAVRRGEQVLTVQVGG